MLMKIWLIPVVVGLILVLAIILSARRWERQTQQMRAQLEQGRRSTNPVPYTSRELAGLPPPVARYFRRVLQEGQPHIASALLTHSGTFSMSETKDKWSAFSSTQLVVCDRPGFDWDGRIRIFPGLMVYVHDAYIAGEGILHASFLGLFTVADIKGTPEVAQGELMRFLAEAAWYPTRLLPSQGVTWLAVDASSARATLSDGANKATLLFRFGADGLIAGIRADARPRATAGTTVLTPWEGRFWNYQRHNGILVPTDGEVAWILPAGPKPYWRGHLERIQFEFVH